MVGLEGSLSASADDAIASMGCHLICVTSVCHVGSAE